MFWRSTPHEVSLLLREIGERRREEHRAAQYRAGIVAATIANVHKKRGARASQPHDFLPEEPKALAPEQMRALFDAWAQNRNAEA